MIYAKSIENAKTNLLERGEKLDKTFSNPDDDSEGDWVGKDPTARSARKNTGYAIQSPFTGNLHYPDLEYNFVGTVPKPTTHWSGMSKKEMKEYLELWGSEYQEKDLQDGRGKALTIAGSMVSLNGYNPDLDSAVSSAKAAALAKLDDKNFVRPKLFFNDSKQGGKGAGRPRIKNYLKNVQRGKVALTYWADEDYDTPLVLGSQSWEHGESGHSQTGINELDQIMGKGHGFETVKPLKLFKKIIHLWCPPNGLVLDAYAGSGTTGHAVLELNAEVEGSDRQFILIEQGAPEKGDKYAKTLTFERLRRAVTGERPDANGNLKVSATPLKGGFEYRVLTSRLDGKAILSMRKDELIDVVITSHWEDTRRKSGLIRIESQNYKYLVGKNEANNPYFIIWNGGDAVEAFTSAAYQTIVAEAKKENLVAPYYVYARRFTYHTQNVIPNKIPDKILAHLGLNENSDRFNEDEENGGE